MKKFNCFNILWDIDDDWKPKLDQLKMWGVLYGIPVDEDVFQSHLPREMSVEVDTDNITNAEDLNHEIVEALTESLGLCVLQYDCKELENFSDDSL